ncbi:MAG: NAD-dependent epimerase/dehydratase family protein [Cyclobacteriaceae bacterium]|nr:NAD-dependent epimerase/dehydratase family protein [Cyclobacteriaceae bacterium]MDH4296177.1 NAD-dependent epimerase/dehydratase family protein [Cyclobacteriaceae bacterium]MDH5251368.1 NAD-dependent epimerase/dehydratase family protein [Cyclobacteriaceae bacterium]
MKIGITGASGHLGTSIAPLLEAKQFNIRALIHTHKLSISHGNTESVHGNLLNSDSLLNFVSGCDVVIHCAAKISINSNNDPSVYATNFDGTVNLFNAAKQTGVKRFVHVSSIHAYNQFPQNELLTEARGYCMDKAPRYDNSKRDAQKYVLQHATEQTQVVVLNPTSVAGPPDYQPSLFGKAIMDLYNHKVPSLIDGGFDFCDVRDVAEGIVNAIDNGRNGNAYLLSGKWHHLSDVIKILNHVKIEKHSLPVLPGWAGFAGLPFMKLIAKLTNEEPLYTRESLEALLYGNKNISQAKANTELNYHCRPFEETLTDLIKWFESNNYLKPIQT